jgi:hypothetical protein
MNERAERLFHGGRERRCPGSCRRRVEINKPIGTSDSRLCGCVDPVPRVSGSRLAGRSRCDYQRPSKWQVNLNKALPMTGAPLRRRIRVIRSLQQKRGLPARKRHGRTVRVAVCSGQPRNVGQEKEEETA